MLSGLCTCPEHFVHLEGHREPTVTGLLIGAKRVGKPGEAILCKATCDWLMIKIN